MMPDKVQHKGIFDILEILANGVLNAAGQFPFTSGVNDGFGGFLTGAEKVDARSAGKAAGRLSLALSVTGLMSDISEYNEQNNARGYHGWDANWRTASNVAISFGATYVGMATDMWSGARVPGTPHMKAAGAMFGGFLGSVAGYELGEKAIAFTRSLGW